MSRITSGLLLLSSLFVGMGVSAPAMAANVINFTTNQTISTPVTLSDDTVYQSTNGSNITFDTTVDGAYSLTVNTAGAVAFTGSVGSTTALTGLTIQSGTLSVASVAIDGDLSITTSDGDIAQTSGGFYVSGTSVFDAAAHAITLTQANDFTGAVSLSNIGANAVAVTDFNGLILGNVNVGTGTLGVQALGITQAVGTAIVQQAAAGAASFNAGGAAATLTNANNDFTGAMAVNGNGLSFTDINDLTIASLTGSSNATVSLVAGGVLTLPIGGFNTGGGDLTLESNGGALVMSGALSGNNVTVSARDGVTLGDDVSATGQVSLSSGASISQSAGILMADTLIGSSTGSTTLNGTNQIGRLGSFSAASFSLINAQSLTVNGPVDGASSLALTTTAGGLAINGAMSGSSTTLSSAGDITEGLGGVLTSGTLSGSSVGNTTLNGSNHIGTLGSFSAANFALTNAQALTAAGPLTTTGGTGDIHLATSSGQLNVNFDLVGNDVSLTSADDLTLGSNITGTTVSLASGGTLSQSGGALVAGTLLGSSTGSTTLDGTNFIGTLGSFTAAGFSLINAQSLTVSGPVDGGASTVVTTIAGNLAMAGAVSGTSIMLNSSGDITEGVGGVLTAGTLTGSSAGDTTLSGANQINALGSVSATNIAFTNAQALTVAGPLTTTGGAGNIQLTTSSGQLNVNTDLAGNDVSLTSATDLTLGSDVTGTTVNLVSGGALSQAGGVLTADTLIGSSVGDTTLNGSNHVSTLGNFSAANIALTNAQALTASGPLTTMGGTGDIHLATTSSQLNVNTNLVGNDVSLTSAADLSLGSDVTGMTVNLVSNGTLSQAGGALTAGTLTGSSTGSTTLNGTNQIGTLGNFTSASFALTNAQALAVAGAVDGGTSTTLITTGASSALTVAGVITGTQVSLTAPGGTIGGTVNGSGGISISAAPGSMEIQPSTSVTGAIQLTNGTLQVDSGAGIGAVVVDAGATLTGGGNAGAIVNHGTVAPGTAGAPYGTLTGASYSDGGGVLLIAVDAANNANAMLNVAGAATLGGSLILDLGGTQPTAGDSFAVLSANPVSGQFIGLSAVGSAINPSAVYTSSKVTVRFGQVIAPYMAVPTLDWRILLLLAALLGVGAVVRLRRQPVL